MHMLDLKRIVIRWYFLLLYLFILVVSSIYFFDVNDYSDWITEQLKDVSGYDIRFEHIENNWLLDNSISLTGLSLYQQQQRVLFVRSLDIHIDKLDFWHRQVVIKSIKLSGINVFIEQALVAEELSIEGHTEVTNDPLGLSEIAWQRIVITKLEINDLNISLQTQSGHLDLKEANISFNDLLLIEHGQLQKFPVSFDFSTALKSLQVQQQQQKVTFNNLQLSVNADLVTQQGQLNLTADKVVFESKELATLQWQSLDLQLQLAQNKLSLKHFVVDTLPGSLVLQADAYLSIKLLPRPSIQVKKVDVLSFIAKDMQLNIPKIPASYRDSRNVINREKLPIEELWIKAVNLKNINVHSEANQLPLRLKSADAQISNFYLIKRAQLFDLTRHSQQAAKFSLAFDYLRWRDAVIEQFSIAGNFSEDGQALHLLRQLVVEQ